MQLYVFGHRLHLWRERTMELWRHLRAIALLPAMVLVVVPLAVLFFTDDVHIGWGLGAPLNALPVALGAVLILAGLGLVGWTVAMFRSEGEGTLAPWDPTQKLVVVGVYRHVRNPMISGVLCALLGEAALLGSLAVLIWFAIFFAGNAVYIPLSEERGLEERFGDEYRRYKRHVPRWLPRVTAWEEDPIKEARGMLKGGAGTKELLEERRRELEREERDLPPPPN